VYWEGKTKEEILAGTTEETMRSLYTRPQRESIYHPATIGDIPQEVLEKAFLPLWRKDLNSASSVCRGWRPVAQEIIHPRLNINNQNNERIASLMCGYLLNSLVFGPESFQIAHLSLPVNDKLDVFIPAIAQLVSTTLSSLHISFQEMLVGDSSLWYEVLGFFFSRCQRLRNLRLIWFTFGNEQADIPQPFKDGFSRLKHLDLIDCGWNVRSFIESTPIPDLKSFKYSNEGGWDGEVEVVDAAVGKYGASLVRLNLGCFVSSANLIKIAELCPSLVDLSISYTEYGEELSLPAIKAIASLPRLKHLKIGINDGNEFGIADDALSALARCYELEHFSLESIKDMKKDELKVVLCGIGRNLLSLSLWELKEGYSEMIVEFCPNLQYLAIETKGIKADKVDTFKQTLKSGLKKLAKFMVNDVSVRLGCD
jgi:hypothetical protein